MTTVPRICGIEGCGVKFFARGLCKSHYEKARYRGALPPRETIAQGKTCEVKDCPKKTHSRNLCVTHYARVTRGVVFTGSEPVRTHDSSQGCFVPNCERPHSTRGLCSMHYQRKRNYTLSAEQVIEYYGRSCELCGTPPPQSGRSHHIDHDHSCCPESGRSCGNCIRGVLCHGCNTAIGSLKEDPELFRRAIAYLSGDLIN